MVTCPREPCPHPTLGRVGSSSPVSPKVSLSQSHKVQANHPQLFSFLLIVLRRLSSFLFVLVGLSALSPFFVSLLVHRFCHVDVYVLNLYVSVTNPGLQAPPVPKNWWVDKKASGFSFLRSWQHCMENQTQSAIATVGVCFLVKFVVLSVSYDLLSADRVW